MIIKILSLILILVIVRDIQTMYHDEVNASELDNQFEEILKNNSLMGFNVVAYDKYQSVICEHQNFKNSKNLILPQNTIKQSINNVHIYINSFGYSNYEKQQNSTQHNYYRIASISKTMTTIGLFSLLEQHQNISLDTPASQVLGFKLENPKYKDMPITLRGLLSHTSSIRDGSRYNDFLMDTYNQKNPKLIMSIRDLLEEGYPFYDETCYGQEPPGFFQYSNLNFGILGTIVEILSGERFDIYMRNQKRYQYIKINKKKKYIFNFLILHMKSLFQKLKITSSFNVADIDDWENIATIYEGVDGKWQPNYDHFDSKPTERNMVGYKIGTNGLVFGPQGGFNTQMKELGAVMCMLANKGVYNDVRILNETSIELMFSNVWEFNGYNGDTLGGAIREYGQGTHISTVTPEKDLIWPDTVLKGHTGFAYGLASNMWFDPVTKEGFVFAINGALHGYPYGKNSRFVQAEQDIQFALGKYLYRKWK